MVSRVLEHVLLPSHRVWNQRHVQRKLGIGVGGKEVKMGTTKHPVNCLEYPWKKAPICEKNLVGTTELARQNIFLPQNIPGHQGDRMMLGPENYSGGYATHDTRRRAALMLEVSDNRGIVAHQDDILT